MKTQAFKKTIFTLLALGSCVMGSGQQKPDSLYSYLEIAAGNNPVVRQRYLEYEAALQKIPQVGSLPDPDVSLGIFLSPMELVGGNQLADVKLMQMFPWFGQIKYAKDEMSLMAKAKYESFRDARLQVFYEVQRTWWDLHKVKQNIRIAEKNIDILHTIERLTIVRFRAPSAGNIVPAQGKQMSSSPLTGTSSASTGMSGMEGTSGNTTGLASSQVTPSMPGSAMGSSAGSSGLADVYRIQMEISDLINSNEQLRSQWKSIAAQFNSYLDRPPDAVVTLPDTLVAMDFQPLWPLKADSTLGNNPMLGMLRYDRQAIEARKLMVTKMSYPMVGVGVDYSLISKSAMSTSSMNGSDMIMPMVTATLPIYRKKYKAMQSEADILESANQQNYRAAANSLQADYYQALQLYQDARRRMKLYADQSGLASKTLTLLMKSYASSNSDLTDVLRLRQQALDYEYRQIEAVADYNTSIAWLKRLTALLP